MDKYVCDIKGCKNISILLRDAKYINPIKGCN